ncbi:hypothetical protein TVAG_393440 [Trichomonas vaginalis G3]|uniref:SSD domain-containing protein n=1 Tax=Trichomonas vaginalis (strain ATCC PRA-98 / G3) TaxID=412133 RepID=A2DYD9_TRIV3|nr:protein dispatched-related family [Trichomonas vaginalis G3]EAY14616.1 hypothetical protein TVAG_393440 [Trichomonas vaginalis G3]KAI5526626.1 protein dispatched-related family [Trichomonas vaginalis G3]|eukprot:XP_001326839.1 hypothetical protein [Trichomonas vaginalis G3]
MSEPDTAPLLSGKTNDEPQGDEGFKLNSYAKAYASFIYDHPFVPIICVILMTLFFTLYLTLVYGIRPQANSNYYRWNGDSITQKWDAYVGAEQDTYRSIFGMFGETIKLPNQFQLTQMGAVIFERKGQNILDYRIMQEIWKMEDEMHAIPGWSDVCFKIPMDSLPGFGKDLVYKLLDYMKNRLSSLEEDTNCIAFKSIITDIKNYFKRQYNVTNPTPDMLNQSFFEEFYRADEVRLTATYVGNDYNNETMTSSRLRSMYPFALPLKGYKNKADRQKEQEDKLGRWQVKFEQPVDAFSERAPYGTHAYPAFVFGLNFKIAALILQQVWWLIGAFLFTFVFAVIVQRSFFTSLLGVIGVFFPIPCALCSLRMFFGITHVDVIDVIGLFLICGIGADCVFIIFELFKQSRNVYGTNNKLRLAYALQRGLIALSTSITTSAVSFLALSSSGVRIMNFFGIFCFMLLLFTFIVTFTWYLGIVSIWAKRWEKHNDMLDTIQSVSQLETRDEADDSHQRYPHTGLFDFLHKCVVFNVNAAGLPIEKYTKYERFVFNKLAPFLYHYRLPIVLVFAAWTACFGYLAMKIPTKSELQFLPDNHPLQRAYSLAYNGFSTALDDFSFVYVWGLKPKPVVSFKDRFTIDNYGRAEFIPINITDPNVQLCIHKAWDIIRNDTEIIDNAITANFGVSPLETWNWIFSIDKWIDKWIPLFALNISIPEKFPITPTEYKETAWLWQVFLSELLYEEPDSYVPGSLKADTIGFSNDDYSLKYIGMKANLFIPQDLSVPSKKTLYDKCENLANRIKYDPVCQAAGLDGFHTGVQ